MSELIKLDNEYKNWLSDVSKRFKQSQIKAAMKVNSEMLLFYFSIGKDLALLKDRYSWGSNFYGNVSKDLIGAIPDSRSFSPRNLRYMHRFYILCDALEILPQVVAKIDLSEKMPQVVAKNNKCLV